MTNIIETQALTKRFNGAAEPAVNEVSFAVRDGEIFSLLGPNGAGKTTTISMLSCLLRPTSGDAKVAGASVTNAPHHVKEVIGVVPQEIALYPKLSARENLYFWGRLYGMSGGRMKERVEEGGARDRWLEGSRQGSRGDLLGRNAAPHQHRRRITASAEAGLHG
jgi:ABC-2 type transport system ATP-binding protein